MTCLFCVLRNYHVTELLVVMLHRRIIPVESFEVLSCDWECGTLTVACIASCHVSCVDL